MKHNLRSGNRILTTDKIQMIAHLQKKKVKFRPLKTLKQLWKLFKRKFHLRLLEERLLWMIIQLKYNHQLAFQQEEKKGFSNHKKSIKAFNRTHQIL